MDSSVLLVQAASGLEKLMSGSRGGVLKDSTVAQISAFVYYEAHVVARLTSNKGNQYAKITCKHYINSNGGYVFVNVLSFDF